jgi:TRAP-type C4-dicarboxylate transport system permease small subunit
MCVSRCCLIRHRLPFAWLASAWAGWRFVDMTSGTISAAIGYPIEALHIMAPICGVLVMLFAAERMAFGAPPKEPEAPAPAQM